MSAIPSNLIRDVIHYRELLFALTWRDIRVKYKQAIFGVLWVFLIPILGIASGVIVQAAIGSLNMEKVGSVMIRTVTWSLFASVMGSTAFGMLGGMGLASKIYFPRQIIPLSSVMGVLFDFAISTTVVTVLLIVTPGSPLTYSWSLLLVPVFLAIVMMMALGLGLFFGSLNIFFRDVKYLVTVMLQFGIMFSPVILLLEQLPKGFQKVIIWNPMAPVLEGMSEAMTHGHIEPWLWKFIGYSAGFALLSLLIGIVTFRRSEPLFAEMA